MVCILSLLTIPAKKTCLSEKTFSSLLVSFKIDYAQGLKQRTTKCLVQTRWPTQDFTSAAAFTLSLMNGILACQQYVK